jgi:hypothetical protein
MHIQSIQPFWILGLLYLVACTHFYANGEKSYLRFRNSILRIYIASDKNKYIVAKEYSDKIMQKIKTKLTKKYYDLYIYYNTLTEEEKTFLDFIISLTF